MELVLKSYDYSKSSKIKIYLTNLFAKYNLLSSTINSAKKLIVDYITHLKCGCILCKKNHSDLKNGFQCLLF